MPPEIQSKLESLNIFNPEDLLLRLEKRGQNLYAEKIRQVAASVPKSTSRGLSMLLEHLDIPDREGILQSLGTSSPTNVSKSLSGVAEAVKSGASGLIPPIGLGSVAAEIKSGLADVASSTDGMEKIGKLSALFNRIASSTENGSLSDALGAGLALRFPGVAKFLGIEPPAEAVRRAAEAAKEKLEKAKADPTSDESFKEYEEQLKEKLGRQLGIDFSEGSGRTEKLKKVFNAHKEAFRDIGKEAQSGTFTFLGIGFESTREGLSFFFDLVAEDVIPIGTVVMDIAKTGIGVIKIGIAAVGKGENVDLGDFSISVLGEAFGQLSEHQKETLAAIVYRKGGIVTSLLAEAGYVASRLALTPLFIKDDVSSLRMSFGTLTGNYEAAMRNFEKMSDILGISGTNEFTKKLADILNLAKEKSLVMAVYSKHPNDAAKFSEELSRLSAETNISGELIEKLKVSGLSSEKLGMDVLKVWKTVPFNEQMSDWKKAFSGILKADYLKGSFASADFVLDDFAKKMGVFDTGMAKTLGSGMSGIRAWRNLENSFKASEMPRAFESALFATTKGEALNMARQLRFMATKSPELVRGILGHLPIIAVAGVAASKDDPFWKAFALELRFLIPLVGPIMIMNDAGLKGFKPENLVNLGIGWGLFVIDAYMGFRAIEKGEFLKYLARPAVDLAHIARGSIETALALGQTGRLFFQAARAGKFTEAFRYLRPVGNMRGSLMIVGLLLALGYGAYETLFKDDPKAILADLEKRGFLFPNGGFNSEKILKEFGHMKTLQKEQILTFMANSAMHDEALFSNPDLKIPVPKLSSVTVHGNLAKIRFGHLPTMIDQENVERVFTEFGLKTAFEYEIDPLIGFAENLKSTQRGNPEVKEGQLFVEYLSTMNALGVPKDLAEKAWRKA